MKCFQCAKKIENDTKVCPYCGAEQGVSRELIEAAQNGDQMAITELYQRTHENVYYTVKSMIRDEDTVQDLVQDTYLQAFRSLGTLQDPASFQGWLRRIAHNLTVNYTKKKKPILFSELTPADGEEEEEPVFEDENLDHMPEEVIDKQETARLIREILNSLSEEQRIAIGMYYYEQYSVREIAETMGVSENTIKSRLSYGRKKIEEQVRALEKKGTKLYGLAPIPFLLFLFRSQTAQAAEAPGAANLQAFQDALEMAKEGGAAAAAGKTAWQTGNAETAAELTGQSGNAETAAEAVGQAENAEKAAGAAEKIKNAEEAAGTLEKAGAAAGAGAKSAAVKGFVAKIIAGVAVVGLIGGGVFLAAGRSGEEETASVSAEVSLETAEETSAKAETETATEAPTEEVTELVTEAVIIGSRVMMAAETPAWLAGNLDPDGTEGGNGNSDPDGAEGESGAEPTEDEINSLTVWGNENLLRSVIGSITFLSTADSVPADDEVIAAGGTEATTAWDVSAEVDGSVTAWALDEDGDGLYELYVAAEGGVRANPESAYLFAYFTSATSISLSEAFDASEVTDMSGMFAWCETLESLDVGKFDTSAVTDMAEMFEGCLSLEHLDLSNFDTSAVTDLSYLFAECTALQDIRLDSFDTSAVTDMSGMFLDCVSLTELDLGSFSTEEVTSFSEIFSGCESLEVLDLSHFSTGNVEVLNDMFNDCRSLRSLNLDNFDTSGMTSMSGMFQGCSRLEELSIRNFDTSSVTDMSYMFATCESLTSLDLGSFDTSSVTNMAGMFRGCASLTALDLSNFDTSNVNVMRTMFYGCSSLTSLNISSFNTANVVDMAAMFYGVSESMQAYLETVMETMNTDSATNTAWFADEM